MSQCCMHRVGMTGVNFMAPSNKSEIKFTKVLLLPAPSSRPVQLLYRSIVAQPQLWQHRISISHEERAGTPPGGVPPGTYIPACCSR